MEVLRQGTLLCKIDYYSSVWVSHSLRDVLKFLKLEDCLDFVLQDYNLVMVATTGNQVKFSYNGIRIEVPFVDFVAIRRSIDEFVATEEVKDHKFSKIRLCLSGVPLDFLRQHFFSDPQSRDVSLDEYLRIPPDKFGLNFHVTRVDFAFDFINYGKDFFAKAFPFLADFRNLTSSGRLSTVGMGAGCSFKPINTPNEKILYIGASNSDRYLRIYDKYLEVKARNYGEFNQPVYDISPFEIQSWIRVEWQIRAKNAMKYLYALPIGGVNYWEAVLQEIVDFYEFRSCRNKNPIPPKFWREFFNMDRLGELDKRVDFVQLPGCVLSAAEKNDNYVETTILLSTLLYVFRHRESGLLDLLRREWQDLITPKPDLVQEYIRQARLSSFRKRLNETVSNGQAVEEAYPWCFDERGNLQYPRYEMF